MFVSIVPLDFGPLMLFSTASMDLILLWPLISKLVGPYIDYTDATSCDLSDMMLILKL